MKAYPIKAKIRAEGGATRVDILDDIGADPFFGGISASAFTEQLGSLRGPLDVHISSAGGMVDQGLAIYNALASYPGPVTTYNDGLAASVASVIMQAGQRRIASPVSALMIHDAWGSATGNAADMESMRAALDKNSDIIARSYAQRAGGTVEQWRQAMKTTTWYDADEALAAGLVDEIAGGASKPAAPVDLDAVAASVPVRIMARLRAAARLAPDAEGDEAPCKTCDGRGRLLHPGTGKNGAKCPSCDGTGRYDPDNDGDDDSTAEGDTDHDYVEPDGSPGPKALAAMTFAELREALRPVFAGWLREQVALMAAAKVDESPWDSSKAWHNGAASDDPEAFYRGICAGHHTSGDPATQAYWALPYRYHPDDPPNAGGVRAAWGVLNGAMGGVEDLADRDAVEAKVKSLMKQVNPDWSPDNRQDTSVFAAGAAERYRAALKGARE